MSRSRVFICLLTLLMALGMFWHYQTLAHEFPFDFIWDMDSSATQDALLINSGHPPAHLDHPKYVMAMLQATEASLMHLTGLSSTASLADLAVSPQPMLGFAELTDQLRSAHALAAWLLLILMIGLLWRLFPALSLLWLFALPLMGLQSGLLYNALTMRSELYSLLLVVCGMWLVVELWQPGKQPSLRRQQLTILSLGLLMGLALLNKIQTISLFFVLPAFSAFCYLRWLGDQTEAGLESDPTDFQAPKTQRTVLAIFAISGLIFALLTGLTLTAPVLPGRTVTIINGAEILKHLPGSLSSLKMQIFWLGFIFSGILAACLLQIRHRAIKSWAPALNLYPLFPAGAMLAFCLPLLSLLKHPDGFAKSWLYTANLIRSAVWLDASLFSQGGNASRQTLIYLFQHRPDLLLLSVATLGLLGLMAWQDRPRRRLHLGACAVLGACLLTLFLGNRPLLRDTLWYEIWCSWAALLGLGQLFGALKHQGKSTLSWLLIVAVVGISFNSMMLAERERESFYVYHSPYGFDGAPYDYFMAKAVYLHHANPYGEIFDQAFEEDPLKIRQAIAEARNWSHIQRQIRHPFVNAKAPLRLAGQLKNRFPAWQRNQQWARFERLPMALQNSPFVALNNLIPHLRNRQYLNDFALQTFQGRLKVPGAPMITLVPPFNYTLIIALPEADLRSKNLVSGPAPEAQSLTVTEQGQTISYRLFQIKGPEALDQRKLARLSSPTLGIVYGSSVQPPDIPAWTPELSQWLGAE